jgi:alanyl-tRNA synthetase
VPQQAASLLQEVRDLKKQISSGSKAKSEAPVIPAPPSDLSESAQQKHALLTAAKLLNTSALDVPTRVAALLKDAVSLRQQAAAGPDEDAISADALLEAAVEVDGVKVIVAEAPGASPNVMRQLIDQLRKKAAPVAILLASSPAEGKVVLVAGVSRDVQDRGASAGNWVKQVAPVVGGGGGGKPDMAQAGGRQPENLPAALEEALSAIRGQLGG